MDNKKCPNCNSYDTIQVGKVITAQEQTNVYFCKECSKLFYDKNRAIGDKDLTYNPKFKQLYLEKKIPEVTEHKNFKYQEKICDSDKIDLKIDFWLMEHKKENENTRTNNK